MLVMAWAFRLQTVISRVPSKPPFAFAAFPKWVLVIESSGRQVPEAVTPTFVAANAAFTL